VLSAPLVRFIAATNGVVAGVSEEPKIEGSKRKDVVPGGRGFGLAISRRLPHGTIISYFRFLNGEAS
jgi:hypothetical protein